MAGLIAALAGCTDPKFVSSSREVTDGSRAGSEEAGAPEPDAATPEELEPVIADAGPARAGDARVVQDAAGEDAAADGGDATASGSDAGDAGTLPAWALGLVGTYAKRSVNFSYEDDVSPPTNTLNVEHSIVKISQDGADLGVSVQLCDYTVALSTSAGRPVIFKHPDRYPPLTAPILLGDTNTFTSGQMVGHLGFEPSRGKDCAGGRRAPYEDQSWITTGSCQCSAGVLPETQSDCRVSDTDRDGRSGITMLNPSILSASYTDVSIVFDYAVTISAGELKPGKRLEVRETRAQTQACINAAVDYCSVGKNQLCPGGSTKLIRLSEQVTDAGCDAIDKGQFGPVDPWPVQVDCRAK